MTHAFRRSSLLLALTAVLAACGAPATTGLLSASPAVAVTGGAGVAVSGSTVIMDPGAEANASWQAGATWTSDDPAVARVLANADGSVRIDAVGAGVTLVHARPAGSPSSQASPGGADLTVQVRAPGAAPAPTGFHVEVRFPDASLTASQRQVFLDAAARWSQVITAALPTATGRLPSGATVTTSGVVIEASAVALDGVNGTLGKAGPVALRPQGQRYLPITGQMQFDSADVANMEQSGMLRGVILHEMGHVLGIGTLWELQGLLSYNASTCDAATSITYTGAHAVNAYRALGGSGNVPVEGGGGSGTKCGHWSEATFGTELMTGWANKGGMPLSRLTVGSLEDLGYTVNDAAADAYTLPSTVHFMAAGAPELRVLRPTPYVVPGR